MTSVGKAEGATASRGWHWPAPIRAIGRFLYPSAPILLPAALIIAVLLGIVAVSDYRQATDFVTNGKRVTADETQVLIGEGGCRGGCASILGVQIFTPELGWLTLSGPFNQSDLPRAAPRGWQQPTEVTGYRPPLALYVVDRGGGVLEGMSVADTHTARTSGPIVRLTIAVLLLLAFAAGIGPYVRIVKGKLTRRRRPSGSLDHPAGKHRQDKTDHQS